MATNTSTRNMLTGYLEAWGAHVSAAVDVIEAKTILGAGLPTDTTAILSLTLCKWRGLTPVPFAAPAALARFVPGHLRIHPKNAPKMLHLFWHDISITRKSSKPGA
jgi:hypothetical protein